MTASPVPVPVLHTASPSEERTLLSLKGVSKRFGGVRALENVSFDVQQGTLLGIIGPNGSGKSTLLSLIAGAQRPSSGQIVCNGRRLDRMRSHAIARLGIGRAHQIPRPFGGMTVRQNLLVAAHSIAGHRAQRDDLIRQVLERCDLLDKSERREDRRIPSPIFSPSPAIQRKEMMDAPRANSCYRTAVHPVAIGSPSCLSAA